jgi:hypothetical protein
MQLGNDPARGEEVEVTKSPPEFLLVVEIHSIGKAGAITESNRSRNGNEAIWAQMNVGSNKAPIRILFIGE